MKSTEEVKDLRELLHDLESMVMSIRCSMSEKIDEFDRLTDNSYRDAKEEKDVDAMTIRNARLQDILIQHADIDIETLRCSINNNPDVKALLYRLLNMGELHNEETT